MAFLYWAGVWDSLVSLSHPPCPFLPPGAALPQEHQTNLKPRGIQCTPELQLKAKTKRRDGNFVTQTTPISGHYLDQKRLKQGLYRHPWDDISYVLPEHMTMWEAGVVLECTRTEACPGDSYGGTVMYKDRHWDRDVELPGQTVQSDCFIRIETYSNKTKTCAIPSVTCCI